MKLPALFNRGLFIPPQDGWYHLVPRGEFAHGDSGLIQVIDDESLASMSNRFAPSVLIDFDHFSYDVEKSSEAAAWVDAVEVRPNGLWGQLRLTDLGEAALKNGRYRFISPVWLRADVEELGNDRVRPLRLDSLGLTNNPNMRGMAPLTNRKDLPGDPANTPPAREPKADNQTTTSMKLIASKLGLSADASEQAIVAEIDKLLARANGAESERDQFKKDKETLSNRCNALLAEQIDADLATAGITDEAKVAKLKPVLSAMQNRADRTDFLKTIVKSDEAEPAKREARQPITNRTTAKQPGSQDAAQSEEQDAAKAQAIRNRAHELKAASSGRTFQQCFAQAEAEFNATRK